MLSTFAERYLGITESPAGSNCNMFSKRQGKGCQPWCADFVMSVCDDARVKVPVRSSYTPTLAQGFKDAGLWGKTPRPDAIVFFDWPDSKHRIQHVGIVEKVNADGTITTIEGNTSSDDQGSQDNGGGVYRRIRSTQYVVGYGYPIPFAQQGEDDELTSEEKIQLQEVRDIVHNELPVWVKAIHEKLDALTKKVEQIQHETRKPAA